MAHIWEIIKAAAMHQVVGVPLYALVLMIGLPVLNEIVQRHQKLTAQSLLQLIGNAIKSTPLYAVPIIKQIADLLGTPKQPAILPPPIQPGAFLPFLLIGALFIGACAQVKAWGKCELNYLPQTLEAALVDGIAIAMDTSKTVQDLFDFAHQVAPGQEDCFLAALEAGTAGKVPAVAAKLHMARAKAVRVSGTCRPVL